MRSHSATRQAVAGASVLSSPSECADREERRVRFAHPGREFISGVALLAVLASAPGPARGVEPIELSDVAAGRGGFVIEGNGRQPGPEGRSLANVGDVNGDGVPDAVLDRYVIFGRGDGSAVELSEVDQGRGGFVIPSGGAGGATVGDMNGDGLADIVVGITLGVSVPQEATTAAYVLFGKTTTEAVDFAEIAQGKGGFVIYQSDDDFRDESVSGIGDVNGDGVPDLVIGAPNADPGGKENAGASYVVFGKRTTETIELSDVSAGRGGFAIRGEHAYDFSGFSVSGAGDVDGDGLEDVLIGAFRADPGSRQEAGATYVVLGKRTTEPVELSDVSAGRGGFVIRGEREDDRSGLCVSGAGDVDGDGLADVLIGAYRADPAGRRDAGAAYVVLGKRTTEALDLLEISAGRGGFVIRGAGECDNLGRDVAAAGDVNGDGLADVILGEQPACSDHPPGATYVVFGKRSTDAVEISSVDAGSGGFPVLGESGVDSGVQFFAHCVSGAGDVNGDGLSDLLVGFHVVYGKASTDAVNLSEVEAGNGGYAIRSWEAVYLGFGPVACAGDINGDGRSDIIVGAPYSNVADGLVPGASFAIFGPPSTHPVDLSAIVEGRGGFMIHGRHAGSSVSAAGDVNGDGLPDLLIAATEARSSYVVFGKVTTDAIDLEDVEAGNGGFLIRGGSGWEWVLSSTVASVGDINGDGRSDLLIGDPGAYDETDSTPGTSYLVFGKSTTTPVDLESVASGQGGFVIRGEAGDRSGMSVAGAGDLNGDGIPDLLIAAPLANPEGRRFAGACYVVFGKSTNDPVELSAVAAGQGGFVIRARAEVPDGQPYSISGGGDVNGDGLQDIVVGAGGTSRGDSSHTGAIYIVLGKTTTEAVELSEVASGRGGFVIWGENANDGAGRSVAGGADVDGDGLADIVIGAPEASQSAGTAYVVLGKRTTEPVELSDVALSQGGFVVDNAGEANFLGSSVAWAGDVNGDGIPDLLLGAGEGIASAPSVWGRAYVVFGPRLERASRFRRGDCNDDGVIDISDAVCILGWLFLGGATPGCVAVTNTNGDAVSDISDAIYLLGHLFIGGPALVAPFPGCGPGTLAADETSCDRPPAACAD